VEGVKPRGWLKITWKEEVERYEKSAIKYGGCSVK